MKLFDFIFDKIESMHTPKFLTQILFSAVMALTPAIPISIVDRFSGWYIDNQVFLTMVFLAVAIDHILGSFVHFYIKHDFSGKKNLHGLLIKGFSVVAGYVLLEMIHQIVNDVQFIAIYFKVVLQLTVILYPILSALKNISIITGGTFPPKAWFDRFEKFNNDLDLNNFKTSTNEEYHSNSDAPIDSELQQSEENAGN